MKRYVSVLTAAQRGAALEALGAKLAGVIDTASGDSAPNSYCGAQDAISGAEHVEVVLTLTRAEAKELNYLAGDLLIDPAELKRSIGAQRYKIAIRAANKLGAALKGL